MLYSQILPTVQNQVPLSQSLVINQPQLQPVMTGSYIQPQIQTPLQQSVLLQGPVMP